MRGGSGVRMIRRHCLIAAQRLAVAAILSVSIILLASQAFAAGFVAQAVKTRGDIRITRDGSDMSCSMGTAIQLGDVITTGADARLRLRFVDGSILTLGEKTKFSIDLFAVDATNKSRTVVLTVLEGIVNAAAAKSGESKFDYQIKTAAGYSAVRGTKWIVGFQQALMSVYVLNGTVEMGGNGDKPPVLLNTGQWGFGRCQRRAVAGAADHAGDLEAGPGRDLRYRDEHRAEHDPQPARGPAAADHADTDTAQAADPRQQEQPGRQQDRRRWLWRRQRRP